MTEVNIKDDVVDGAPFVKTSKMGGVIVPKFIVLHFTAGWKSEGDIYTLAKSARRASAHGVLSRDGVWTQIVPFNTKAWHAGPSKSHGLEDLNNYSIGIEVSNIGYLKKLSNGTYQDEYGNVLDGDGKVRSGKVLAWSAPSTWHEHYNPRLARGTYVWEPFYEPQLTYLDALIPALLKEYPSIKWIVTHEEIDTRGWKTDINGGGAFPMQRYLSLLDDHDDLSDHTVKHARVASNDGLSLRVSPDAQAKMVLLIPDGAVVEMLREEGKWQQVRYGSHEGYVNRAYLRAA